MSNDAKEEETFATLQASSTTHVDVRSIDLTFVDGPDRGRTVSVGAGTTRIGAAEGNQVVVHDPLVSRVHCEIRVGRDRVQLLDLGSRNGTWLEGVRIEVAHLASGGVIRIGSSAIRADFGRASAKLPVSTRARFGKLVGATFEMRSLYAVLERVANTMATVLIRGETGTGKELAARALHEESSRRAGPFVAVDCGAIAPSLIESELFGHVRGAFSGAMHDRRGLFEEAHGGTLFLDEIGELPLSLQPKLLRALETREVRRVGSNVPLAIDVRVVAATNRPLVQAVNDGSFREDLYYRLAVVEVELPPLRIRRDDIPLLAATFNAQFAPSGPPIPDAVVATLRTRGWPGNVRELRNFVERGASLGWDVGGAPAGVAELPERFDEWIDSSMPLQEARGRFSSMFERAYARKALAASGGNVTRAAELAGVNRRTFQRLLSRNTDDGTGGRDDDKDD